MHNDDCDLQVEASKATNTLLEGLDGKYLENCDCKVCLILLVYVGCYDDLLCSLSNMTSFPGCSSN